MPTIHGTAVGPGLKYRFVIATLLVYILYSHWRFNRSLSLVFEKATNNLAACQSNAESLVVKLRVIFEHKKRLEKIFNLKRLASHGKIKVHERMLRMCQENLTLLSAQIDNCQSSNVGRSDLNNQERTELDNLRAQTASLASLNGSLNEVILKKRKDLEACSKEVLDLQNSLSACQETVKKHVGVAPVAHYTQNKTAYFERKYKVGDALAFDRDQDAFKPPMLLPAKELLGKLAEKAQIAFHGEDADLHPDDRGNDDDYVNEVPDVNEKDYKENKQF